MTAAYQTSHTALPDPEAHPEVYRNVLPKRLGAWVFDALVVAAISVAALPFTAFTGVFFFPGLMLFIGFFYRWFTIAGQSSTWGMRLMGIEFRDMDLRRFDSGTAFWHTAGFTLSVVVAPLQLISVLMMLLTPRGQGLTDHIMGTAAVNKLMD